VNKEVGEIETPKALRGRGMGRSVPLPGRLKGLGSVVSSPSGVWSTAPAEIEFGVF